MTFAHSSLAASIVVTVVFGLLFIGACFRATRYRVNIYLVIFTLSRFGSNICRCLLSTSATSSQRPATRWNTDAITKAYAILVIIGYFVLISMMKHLCMHWYFRIFRVDHLPTRLERIRKITFLTLTIVTILGICGSAVNNHETNAMKDLRYVAAWVFAIKILLFGWAAIKLQQIVKNIGSGEGHPRFVAIIVPLTLFLVKAIYHGLMICGIAEEELEKEWVWIVLDPLPETMAVIAWLWFDLRRLFKPEKGDEEDGMALVENPQMAATAVAPEGVDK